MEIQRVLVVSSYDRSRGPAGEVMLRRRLGQRSDVFEIWSAGTVAQDGAELHPTTAEALSDHGLGIRRHRARKLVLADLLGADLVLSAERKHRVQVARISSEAAAKTLTLAEFARLAPHLQPACLDEMVAQAVVLRGRHPAAEPADDDVPDIEHGDRLDHERMVRRLSELISPIAAALSLAASNAPRQSGRRSDPTVVVTLPAAPVAPRQ